MQKKNVVAVLIVASALLLASVPMFAQAAPSAPAASTAPKAASDQDIQLLREDIRSQRKQITAANMTLTADEATKFWPIYDQYAAEVTKIGDARWALIQDYAKNYGTMTDAQVQDFIKRSGSIDQQLNSTRLKYVSLFEKVVPVKKAGLWYQIDRRLGLLLDLQLAAAIPVVDPNK